MLLAENDKYEIRLETDKEARTLSISDTGIGMSRDEVTANIGEQRRKLYNQWQQFGMQC